jgi:hypothetical protein
MSQSFALLERLLTAIQANQECDDDHYRQLPDVLEWAYHATAAFTARSVHGFGGCVMHFRWHGSCKCRYRYNMIGRVESRHKQ